VQFSVDNSELPVCVRLCVWYSVRVDGRPSNASHHEKASNERRCCGPEAPPRFTLRPSKIYCAATCDASWTRLAGFGERRSYTRLAILRHHAHRIELIPTFSDPQFCLQDFRHRTTTGLCHYVTPEAPNWRWPLLRR
jgi:hypothetical protein